MHHTRRHVNTQAARDVLYIQCLTKRPGAALLLDAFQDARPEGAWSSSMVTGRARMTMQVYIASGIGLYRSTAHLPILRRIALHGTLGPGRGGGTCQYIDRRGRATDVRGPAMPTWRADGCRALLAIINDRRSLPEVMGYLEREDPVHVGYVATGWDTVKQLAGTDFNRDLDQLRAYLKER
ncbi:MAG: hypothetical protein R2818_04755 [Flavobacteriales bacterium]